MDLFVHLIYALFSFFDKWIQDVGWKIYCCRQIFRNLFIYVLITLNTYSKRSSFKLLLEVLNLKFLQEINAVFFEHSLFLPKNHVRLFIRIKTDYKFLISLLQLLNIPNAKNLIFIKKLRTLNIVRFYRCKPISLYIWWLFFMRLLYTHQRAYLTKIFRII